MTLRSAIRTAMQRTPAYPWLQSGLEWVQDGQALRSWVRCGAAGPPPQCVKQGVLRQHAARFGLEVLVETGTYFGGTVNALRHDMARIISVEVDEKLAALARRRFAGDAKVQIIQGDSARVIAEVVPRLTSPALFWLDGHYSGGVTGFGESHCPILQELPSILDDQRFAHVILIDDARAFGSDPAYPTIEAVRNLVKQRRHGTTVSVQNDIIRCVP